jgi:isopenicillin N synthase-like dioxygenase
VCDIETVREGKRVSIASDDDVYELNEGDNITFAKLAEPRPVENEVDLPYDLKYESYLDYVKDHFANWRCGFWAVCGKMTYEEEMSIINALIEADESTVPEEVATVPASTAVAATDAVDAPVAEVTTTTPAPSSNDFIPIENIHHPHWVLIKDRNDLVDPRLNVDAVPLFAASARADPSMRSEIVRTWHKRQYVMIELPPELDASCKEVQSAGQQFFLQPLDVKLQCVDERERYLGYAERPAFHKELFQARRTFVPNPTHWPAAMPSLQNVAMANYNAMEALCQEMMSLACSELGFPDEYAAQLKEHPGDPGNGVVSMSNLTLFKYGLEDEAVDWLHLPYHTDIGLVTIIPRAAGHGGLHVYDWVLNSWVDVEATVPEG